MPATLLEVIYLGEHNNVAGMARAVLDEDADVAGLSFSSAAYLEYTRQFIAALRERGVGDVPMMIGGLTHPDDHASLRDMGWDLRTGIDDGRNHRFRSGAGASLTGESSFSAAVLAGDRRAAAQLISRIEAGDSSVQPDLRALYRAGGKARMIGITGPPGAGKSTLVARLIEQYRSEGLTVAVLAVNPSSPLSGGAILGDRARMLRHSDDPGVMIRSMAARGALGGLAHAAGDSITVLDALGFEAVIIETVGVGQSETDVLNLADVVILLQMADSGDGVQAIKAGVLEIADIIVVNKAETPGSDQKVSTLTHMLAHRVRTAEGWDAPVLATNAATGTGVAALAAAIQQFFVCRDQHPADARHRFQRQMRARVLAIAEISLRRRLSAQDEGQLETAINAAIERRSDPHEVAALLSSSMASQR